MERAINKLKDFRAIAMRTDKREFVFRGTIDVASITIWLRTPPTKIRQTRPKCNVFLLPHAGLNREVMIRDTSRPFRWQPVAMGRRHRGCRSPVGRVEVVDSGEGQTELGNGVRAAQAAAGEVLQPP